MTTRTFLSLSLRPWSFSFGTHLLLFMAIAWAGRGPVLNSPFIDLDLTSSPGLYPVSKPLAVGEEWSRKPVRPPAPRPVVNPAPPMAASVGQPLTAMGQTEGSFPSITQISQPPRFIHQAVAPYPDRAKRANIEGVVILQVDIDAAGGVKKVDLIKGLGYGCDEAALAAVRQSTFTPAFDGGGPVPARIRIPYRFKLEN